MNMIVVAILVVGTTLSVQKALQGKGADLGTWIVGYICEGGLMLALTVAVSWVFRSIQ